MRSTIFFVSIDGMDVSTNFMSHLISVQINQTDGGKSDSCDIVLDDSYGQLMLPREDADIIIMLSWSIGGGAVMFEGKTDTPESVGSRGGGMTMNITGRAADMKGDPKQKKQAHKDKKKFKEVAQDWGKKAGLQVKVADKLADKEREYWSMQNENFMQWGSRVAKEMGATFKIMGKKAVFIPRNSGSSASGTQLPQIMAVYGSNLIQWRITPADNRPRFNRSIVRWYDKKEAKWKKETVQVQDETARVPLIETRKSPNKDHAKDRAQSNADEAERGKGGGTITLDGEPNAQPQAICMVSGIRPGIDGMYRITQVRHNFSRDDGWTTMVDLEQPQDEAGKDSRKAASGKTAA